MTSGRRREVGWCEGRLASGGRRKSPGALRDPRGWILRRWRCRCLRAGAGRAIAPAPETMFSPRLGRTENRGGAVQNPDRVGEAPKPQKCGTTPLRPRSLATPLMISGTASGPAGSTRQGLPLAQNPASSYAAHRPMAFNRPMGQTSRPRTAPQAATHCEGARAWTSDF